MKYKINQAVVIGSGTMGAAIAAHLANAGVRTASAPESLLGVAKRRLPLAA